MGRPLEDFIRSVERRVGKCYGLDNRTRVEKSIHITSMSVSDLVQTAKKRFQSRAKQLTDACVLMDCDCKREEARETYLARHSYDQCRNAWESVRVDFALNAAVRGLDAG